MLVYLNVALYATCYQLQRPVEPFMIEKLSKADPSSDGLVEYAKLQSFFSALQMVGSIFIGRFLDRFGPRNGFLLTFASSALSYFLLSRATTIDILYISKIPTIFQAGFLCAQTIMSQITSDGTQRSTALGRLTLAYTVGMVVGPAAGGFLGSTGDYYFGATLACYGSLLSCAITLLLPRSIPPQWSSSSSASVSGDTPVPTSTSSISSGSAAFADEAHSHDAAAASAGPAALGVGGSPGSGGAGVAYVGAVGGAVGAGVGGKGQSWLERQASDVIAIFRSAGSLLGTKVRGRMLNARVCVSFLISHFPLF